MALSFNTHSNDIEMWLKIFPLSLLLSLSPMNSIQLVNGLSDYLSLLTALEVKEQAYYQGKGEPVPLFSRSVSLSYSSIKLNLEKIITENGEQSTSIYILCEFDVNQKNVLVSNVYCQNRDREKDIKDYALEHKPTAFPMNKDVNVYDKETLHYLAIADDIAKEAYLCSSGDDYRPGYFSEIIVEEGRIILRQINHWNSRSIAHKDDYFMRDLEFYIPLTPADQKPSFQDEQIGRMIIRFQDGSSKNNRVCGDKIKEKIEENKVKFVGEFK